MDVDCGKCKDKCRELELCKIEKLESVITYTFNNYGDDYKTESPPNNWALMNKINEIIDRLNGDEKSD